MKKKKEKYSNHGLACAIFRKYFPTFIDSQSVTTYDTSTPVEQGHPPSPEEALYFSTPFFSFPRLQCLESDSPSQFKCQLYH